MATLEKTPIAKLEADAVKYQKAVNRNGTKFLSILTYLETSKRFRENNLYKDATFSEYLNSRFCMSINEYMNLRFAFIKHPTITAKYGAGTVVKVRNKVPAAQIDTVFKEFEELQKKYSKPLPISQIFDKIVPNHEKPSHVKFRKQIAASALTKKDLQAENIRLKAENIQLHKDLAAANEQIEKLKTALKEYKRYHAAFENIAETVRQEVVAVN